MSSPARVLENKEPRESLTQLVRAGLLAFWRQALPEDGPLPGLLLRELGGGAHEDLDWQGRRRQLEDSWPPAGGPLARLIEDYRLSVHEAFLLTLIGEMESSHLLNLVVRELQAPAPSARPRVHLCVSLINTLFAPISVTALDIAGLELVRNGLLQLDGDGPTPGKSLYMPASLWSVLRGDDQIWPGCRWLTGVEGPSAPAVLRQELPKIATLLAVGEMRGLILRGNPDSGRGAAAAALAALLGLRALEVPVEAWRSQPALGAACVYGGWFPVLRPVVGPGEVWRPQNLHLDQPIVVLLGTDGAVEAADMLELEMPLPDEGERRALWRGRLTDDGIAIRAATALLSGPATAKVAANAALLAQRAGESLTMQHVAEARRELGAERLRLLAQPISRRVTAEALVVPPLVSQALAELVERARRRQSLWRGLGATLQATPNAGVRALFVGPSGTGKTLAASFVATVLAAPLYRVDLSAVMNKYIGESEKNLSALLDQAAASDVVLLFDEADSLFGSRTEGKETGERYANMLTNFLLTRIENHPGIVILTTNSRERIDTAFTRRLDQIIEFPLPGFEERLRLWRSHLGERGPGDETYRFLASYCDLAGGQLRNVVIAAATRAEGWSIEAGDLLHGLKAEYRKLGRSLPAKLDRLGQS